MIAKDVVFILGAGASWPYGLPTGAELRRLLCADLRNESSETFGRVRDCGFQPGLIRLFAEAFLASNRSSIDAFLANRPDFHEVGVTAIAAALLPLEVLTNLYAVDDIGDGDWYQYLWGRMLEGVQGAEDVVGNKVRFITFNYDRSLEVFLLTGLQHSFNLRLDQAHALLPPIHHVYGSLGDFDDKIGYRYGIADIENIQRAATRIKTVPSARPSVDEEALSWMKTADTIYLVGFGYDEMNCRRLGFGSLGAARLHAGKAGTRMVGTAYRTTEGERNLAQRHTASFNSTQNVSLILYETTGLEFVRQIANELV
jgi:hypothetical protein